MRAQRPASDLLRRVAVIEARRQQRQPPPDSAAGLAVLQGWLAVFPPPPSEGLSFMGRVALAMATHPALLAHVEAQQRTAPSLLWTRLLNMAARAHAQHAA